MKRIIIFMLALLNGPMLPASVTIRIEATFGAKKRDCQGGVGVCTARTLSRSTSDGLNATLTLSPDESVLTFCFDASAINDGESRSEGGMFIQEESYRLPDELAAELGYQGVLIIPAGSFTVRPNGGKRSVDFPVGEPPAGMR